MVLSIGATLASKMIVDAIGNGSGFFQHGHTYLGHPAAAAAGEQHDLPWVVRCPGRAVEVAEDVDQLQAEERRAPQTD